MPQINQLPPVTAPTSSDLFAVQQPDGITRAASPANVGASMGLGSAAYLGAGGPNGAAVLDPSGNASAFPVLATGATTVRSLAARAADAVNVLDHGAKFDGATDDTAAWQSAINAALSLPFGGKIVAPSGTTVINGALSVALSPNVSLEIEGAAGSTIIQQNASTHAFAVSVPAYTTQLGQAFNIHKVAFQYSGATAYGGDAIHVTSTASRGQQGLPVSVDQCAFRGAWSACVNIYALPTNSYVTRCLFFLSGNSIGITFAGNATSGVYSVALTATNNICWGGAIWLNIGAYVQGVITGNNNVVAAQAIVWNNTAGTGEQLSVTGGYHRGGIYCAATGSASLIGVAIIGSYFDGNSTAAPAQVYLGGVGFSTISGNIFSGNPSFGGLAVHLSNGSVNNTISGNTFSGFEGGSGNGTAIQIDAGANDNVLAGNAIVNTAIPVTNNGSGNLFVGTRINGNIYINGYGGSAQSAHLSDNCIFGALAIFNGPANFYNHTAFTANLGSAYVVKAAGVLNLGVNASSGGSEASFVSNTNGFAFYSASSTTGAIDSAAPLLSVSSAGMLKIGTGYTAGAPTTTGYIEITDSSGAVRKVPCA